MERWQGKVAVVTGSSSGIGAAVSTSLVENGMIVVGLARRRDRLKELANKLDGMKGRFYFQVADLSKEEDILRAFSWIDENLGGVHVLVNNAGIVHSITPVAETETDQWKRVLDVNVLALTICSREALRSMKKHNIDDGNIINISSVVAHMSSPLPGYAMYTGSKRAVQAITAGMRVELAMSNSKIKVTTICPGLVQTEILEPVNNAIPPGTRCLESEDIAQTVVFCLQMPPSAQVTDLVIEPVGVDLKKFSDGLKRV